MSAFHAPLKLTTSASGGEAFGLPASRLCFLRWSRLPVARCIGDESPGRSRDSGRHVRLVPGRLASGCTTAAAGGRASGSRRTKCHDARDGSEHGRPEQDEDTAETNEPAGQVAARFSRSRPSPPPRLRSARRQNGGDSPDQIVQTGARANSAARSIKLALHPLELRGNVRIIEQRRNKGASPPGFFGLGLYPVGSNGNPATIGRRRIGIRPCRLDRLIPGLSGRIVRSHQTDQPRCSSASTKGPTRGRSAFA